MAKEGQSGQAPALPLTCCMASVISLDVGGQKGTAGSGGADGFARSKHTVAERGCRHGWEGDSLPKLLGKQVRADGQGAALTPT